MRSTALLVTLLGGCLYGPYQHDYNDNPELRRGADSVVLCDNGGFVANVGTSRFVGMASATFEGYLGVRDTGARAFQFTETPDGFESVELGAGWTYQDSRTDVAEHDGVAAKCAALEIEPWFGDELGVRLPAPLAVQKLVYPFATMEECAAAPSTPATFDLDEYCHDRLLLCPDGSWQASGGYPGANDIARFAATYTDSFGALSWADTGGFGQMSGVFQDGTLLTSIYRDWQVPSRWDVVTPAALGFSCP